MPRHPTTLSSNNSHWMCCPGAFATWRQFYKIGFVGTPQMRSWEIHFLKKLSSMKMENQIKGNLELSRWTRKIAEEDCNLERKWGLAAQFKEERVFSTKCVWLLGGFEISSCRFLIQGLMALIWAYWDIGTPWVSCPFADHYNCSPPEMA